jgi:signal transduction histidine kinase/HPt (histidine-containing phosphotransfer) domain-containing protein
MSRSYWYSRQTIRTKLLLSALATILIVVGTGGTFLLHLARKSMKAQIESDMSHSQDLLTSLVRQTSESAIRNYLRGISEKNFDIVSHFYKLARDGKLPEKDAKAKAAEVLLSQLIGDTGYMVAMDSHAVIQVHPKAAGQNISHLEFAHRMIALKNGYLEYDWKNPNEKVFRPKAQYETYFEPWDWYIVASSYRSEFTKLINLHDLSESILSVRMGHSGYSYILDLQGNVLVHPSMVGQNIIEYKDVNGRPFIREMLASRHGTTAYTTKASHDEKPRERIALYREIPEFGWLVSTTMYTDEVYAPLEQLKRAMIGAGILTLLISGLMLYLVGVAITRPISALMSRIEGIWKDLNLGSHVSQTVDVFTSRDEVALLTRSFDTMAVGLRLRDRQLAEHRSGLEDLVQKRTKELSTRNQEMRIVLDMVDQGLATLLPDGTLGSERSAAFDDWFPSSDPSTRFSSFLSHDIILMKTFELAWESVIEDVMPIEVSIDCLPKRIVREKQHLEFNYQPIFDDTGKPKGVLMIISDVTAQVKNSIWEAEQHEFIHVFEHVVRDKAGFFEFFNEATSLTEELSTKPPADCATLRRMIHTLKGNAGIFGLNSIADLCHTLETRANESGTEALREALPSLASRWSAFAARITRLMGTESQNSLEVSTSDLDTLVRVVEGGALHSEILTKIRRLRLEPTKTRFRRIAEQARALAQRLGKGNLTVDIEDNDVRLPVDRWAPFWAVFIHAIRNAVDHGIEPSDQRGSKPSCGRIVLRSEETANGYAISISDDGRGVDWDVIRHKAHEKGMRVDRQEDLIDALFSDGISTKGVATEISGRGLGMGALRQQCLALGGTIHVESITLVGTTIHFDFPKEVELPLSAGRVVNVITNIWSGERPKPARA